jgi:hypothetical protein
MNEPARTELRCRTCGYGIVVSGEPPTCPLCRSDDWVEVHTTFPQLLGDGADAFDPRSADDRYVL